ncbi:MAG: tetrahydrofolate dehydrogenase/cyclohydrolase catalytic domain-containing protein, partial [Nitrospinota bacterium]
MGAKVIDLGDRRVGAKIIDGKKIAAEIRAEIKVEVDRYIDEGRRPPALAVILVGRDHASQIYVKNKRKDCAKAGIKSVEHLLNDSVKEIELLHVIDRLNRDPEIDGILVQLPLPGKLHEHVILE